MANLGEMTTETERDAVHVAVIPVILEHDSFPGQDFKGVGVIDPFLRGRIPSGSRVWVLMYPNTVKDIRHTWTHPAFDDDVLAAIAEELEVTESELRIILAEINENGYYVGSESFQEEWFALDDGKKIQAFVACGLTPPDDLRYAVSCSC